MKVNYVKKLNNKPMSWQMDDKVLLDEWDSDDDDGLPGTPSPRKTEDISDTSSEEYPSQRKKEYNNYEFIIGVLIGIIIHNYFY